VIKNLIEQLEAELVGLRKLKNTQSNQGSKNAVTNELVDCQTKIEPTINEIDRLNEQLRTIGEKLDKTQDQSLIDELNNLKTQLAERENELKQLKEKNKALENQLNSRCRELKEQIDEKKQELQQKKRTT